MVYGVCASATTENIDIGTDIGRLVVGTALSRAWPAGDGPEASLSGRDASFGRRVAAKATGKSGATHSISPCIAVAVRAVAVRALRQKLEIKSTSTLARDSEPPINILKSPRSIKIRTGRVIYLN